MAVLSLPVLEALPAGAAWWEERLSRPLTRHVVPAAVIRGWWYTASVVLQRLNHPPGSSGATPLDEAAWRCGLRLICNSRYRGTTHPVQVSAIFEASSAHLFPRRQASRTRLPSHGGSHARPAATSTIARYFTLSKKASRCLT